jgi:hypothetical protein
MARNPHMSKAPPYSAAEIESIRLPGGTTERDAVAVEELLCGFVRHGKINVHSEPWRIQA